jgi:hypothetical protein
VYGVGFIYKFKLHACVQNRGLAYRCCMQIGSVAIEIKNPSGNNIKLINNLLIPGLLAIRYSNSSFSYHV